MTEKLEGIILRVSSAMLSVKFVSCFTLRLETGCGGTGCCALPAMASKNKKISIQPKDFNSSSFSDMVMAIFLPKQLRYNLLKTQKLRKEL